MTAESWRYANCPCKGKEHHPTWVSSDASDGFLPDCQKTVLVPDSRLQAITDAPRCEHDRIDKHDYQEKVEGGWHTMICGGAPELRVLLDALTEENET